MGCEWTPRRIFLLTALVALAVALAMPAAGQAAAPRAELTSSGVLARGSGYATPAGSDPVRVLQRRLRRLGDRPGPIDGLYGPLTEGAVERFQRRQGLAVDGMVGRQTKRSLYPPVQPTAEPAHHESQPSDVERKSPVPQAGAESADDLPARPAQAGASSRAGPHADTSVSGGLVALVAGLAGLLLLAVLWRAREASVSLGLVCAALLGVFGVGAAVGAIFATEAAPEGVGAAKAQTGALLAGPGAHQRSSARVPRNTVAGAKARRTAADVPAAAPFPTAPAPARLRRAPAPAAAAAPVRRAEPATYVVQPGDSLSAIARRQLAAGSSSVRVVEKVQRLTELNVGDRIRSGDPDLLEIGEELRLP